jgi:hypothetical protein
MTSYLTRGSKAPLKMGGSHLLLVRPWCKHIAHMNVASLNLTRQDYTITFFILTAMQGNIINNISTQLVINNVCSSDS